MSEFRRDPITDCWVLIAEARSERPQEFAPLGFADQSAHCPFCRGREHETPEAVAIYPMAIDGNRSAASDWLVRVVPNKYPAIAASPGAATDAASAEAATDAARGDGLYESRPGLGVHEVIIESPDHVTRYTDLDERQFRIVFTAYRDRLLALRREPRLKYALLFKNSGPDAGASLAHVHSQLLAMPHVPAAAQYELTKAYEYGRLHGRGLLEDVVERELASGARVVAVTDRFVVFCPFASRFPFETWLVPRAAESRFEASSSIDEASALLRRLLIGVELQLGRPAYNFWIRTAPLQDSHADFRWRIEVAPRPAQPAGFELASGCFINPCVPEAAALQLRESWEC